MSADGHAAAGKDGEPAGSGADPARGVEQPEAVFAGGEAGEALAGGVVGGDEQLLAVQHRGIGRARVVAVVEVEALQVGDDGALDGGVRHAVEVVVGEVRHAGTAAEELDEGEPVHGAGQLPGAPFVDPQHRGQVSDSGVVDVEGVGKQLADASVAAGSVDRARVAGRERALFIGKERGIPAGHGNTHLPQPQQVVPAPAAVVEERALSTDDVVLDRKRHRPRQRVPADRRSVRSCRTHGTSPASAYLRFAGCAVLSDAALQERNVERCPVPSQRSVTAALPIVSTARYRLSAAGSTIRGRAGRRRRSSANMPKGRARGVRPPAVQIRVSVSSVLPSTGSPTPPLVRRSAISTRTGSRQARRSFPAARLGCQDPTEPGYDEHSLESPVPLGGVGCDSDRPFRSASRRRGSTRSSPRPPRPARVASGGALRTRWRARGRGRPEGRGGRWTLMTDGKPRSRQLPAAPSSKNSQNGCARSGQVGPSLSPNHCRSGCDDSMPSQDHLLGWWALCS